MSATPPAAEPAIDVMLLLEGTYPYVSGGVSSWVHQIINGFPELRFHLCFLGSRRDDYGEARYKLPPNVAGLTEHYLFSEEVLPRPQGRAGDAATAELVRKLHEQLREGDSREARAKVLEQSL